MLARDESYAVPCSGSRHPAAHCRWLGGGFFGDIHYAGKRLRITYRQVRQDLPVEPDVGRLQSVGQSAVGDAVQTSRRVNAGDPQSAHVTLAGAAITARVKEGLQHGLIGAMPKQVARHALSLGYLQNLVVTAAKHYPALSSRHNILLSMAAG